MPAKKCSKSKGTKQKLLECAAVIFTDKGYAHTSISEICEMAGANIASINYHFRSKDALYREILRYTYDQAETLYPLDINFSDSPSNNLYKMVLSLLQRTLSPRTTGNFYKLLAKEMADPVEASRDVVSTIIISKKKLLHKIISGIYGEKADEEQLARLTYSVISQCLFLSYNEKGRSHHLKKKPFELKDAEMFAKHITNFSLAGIKYYLNQDDTTT